MKSEMMAIYRGHVSDLYHAHTLAWEIAKRRDGIKRDFLFRYREQEDGGVLFHLRNTDIDVIFENGCELAFAIDVAPSLKGDNKTCRCSMVEQVSDWFSRQAEMHGFQMLDGVFERRGTARCPKKIDGKEIFFTAHLWMIRGRLKVVDAQKFKHALQHGIGRMKTFGQGMMVVAPSTLKGDR